MTTAQEKKTLKQQLSRDGKMDFFYNPPPRAQYYRPDGTPLPNLLPSDAYGMQRYLKKGFTLSPPEHPVAVTAPPADTVQPMNASPKIERVEAIAAASQARRQALFDDASAGFEGESPLTLVEPPGNEGLTEDEERAIYEKWKAKDERENVSLIEVSRDLIVVTDTATTVSSTHLHRFKTNRIGTACLIEGCDNKRQRKSTKRSK